MTFGVITGWQSYVELFRIGGLNSDGAHALCGSFEAYAGQGEGCGSLSQLGGRTCTYVQRLSPSGTPLHGLRFALELSPRGQRNDSGGRNSGLTVLWSYTAISGCAPR